ncbi:hypothetical protein [Clostridium gasigenes]|uniref:Uncharacterized protein n=1 Tax=Clostridium gasigenes TaxID=94869 RepID=A0A1H0RYL5_9CLOT|nr:hypothetical protein [Clostridium gasigenes]MBB6622650.1 hypothetical protein [Clostridium gasigenes]MBU3088582.1 hypothetical protein [Clostridium gasigenes]MBU3103821.1 hypothetical protein [Clostridium gasigenes]MBU3108227.1 hypothetical protein [Clostridium gasigenes]MBU3132838.1 hypothetical protein [Clostridium gasigenes]
MGIIKLQIIILITIILSGILGGKKGAIISGLVWLVASIIMMHSNIFAVIQLITVTISYQISLLVGIGRDYYIKRKNIKI